MYLPFMLYPQGRGTSDLPSSAMVSFMLRRVTSLRVLIKAARSSGELKRLSRTAIEADVAAFLVDLESVAPVARLHKVILHRTALLRMDENPPPGVTPPTRRLNEAELRCVSTPRSKGCYLRHVLLLTSWSVYSGVVNG